MEFEKRKKISTYLDITPLIDIVFLLIIFFMLTANFVTHPGIMVKLPYAETARPEKDDSVIIHISAEDLIRINGEKAEIENLENILERFVGNTPDIKVVLRADEKIDLGLAVRVMDVSRKAGAGSLVISTDSGKK
ncbi:MAG: biopolymer transporter ExbD [Candidatus Omnitrophota bacterium]